MCTIFKNKYTNIGENMKTITSFKEYKSNKKKEKIIILFAQIILLISFVFLWEMLVNFNVLNEFLVSKPSSILNLFISYMSQNTLLNHIGISVIETVLGLIIGTTLGLVFALILYFFDILYKISEPYLTILNALPKTALAPIIIIWAGTNMKGIILVSVSLSLVITIISSYTYFVNTDKDHIKMMKVFKANKFQILKKVILPSNFANILSIIKINIGLSWVGTIIGEFLVSKNGIGYLLMYGGQVFRLDLVMMGVIILSIIAFIMYEIIAIIEKHFRKNKIHK